jgi:hypothetical protein
MKKDAVWPLLINNRLYWMMMMMIFICSCPMEGPQQLKWQPLVRRFVRDY